MRKRNIEKDTKKERIYLLAEDFKSDTATLTTQGDLTVTDTYPAMNIIVVETTVSNLYEVLREGNYHVVDRAIIEKIEPAILEIGRAHV